MSKKRKITIQVSGLIGCGKTTLIYYLEKALKDIGINDIKHTGDGPKEQIREECNRSAEDLKYSGNYRPEDYEIVIKETYTVGDTPYNE